MRPPHACRQQGNNEEKPRLREWEGLDLFLENGKQGIT